VRKVIQAIIKYGIPVVIGVGLFYFLYKNVNLEKMMASLSTDVNYLWFIAVIIVSIFSHIFRAFRWRLQLRAIGVDAPISAIINSIFGTYAVNLVFPRLGEVWRSGYIANRQKASFTKVLGSMVADRLTDTITVLLLTVATFFIASSAFYKFLDTYPQMKNGLMHFFTSPVTWIVVVVIAVLLIWLFRGKTENKFVNKIKLVISNLWNGFYAITKMDGKWWFLLYTLLIWGCYFFQLYLATFAFSFTQNIGIVATLVLFVLSSIGMGIPTNGGLGSWHIAIIFGLSLYGVGQFAPSHFDPQASAFAMLVWGIQTVLLIVLGIYAFVYMDIDRRHIASGKTKVNTTGDQMNI
jgi:uncharacterized membrane protein YbhN (UPF0104 family)